MAGAMGLLLLSVSCGKTEQPATGADGAQPGEAVTADAQPGAGGANGAGGTALTGGAAPAVGGGARTRPAQTGSTGAAPAGNAATSSGTSGWGDQTRPAQPAPPVAKTYTLPAGAALRVRTTSTMSTKSLESGAPFAGSLAEALEVDGKVIAERGANVTGTVLNSDPGGRVKGRAMLQVAVTRVQLVNGEMANVDTTAYEQLAKASTKKDAAKIAIGSGVGAAIGAIAGGGKGAAIGAGVGAGAGTGTVLATRGDPAVIPAESVLTFTTQGPVSVTLP